MDRIYIIRTKPGHTPIIVQGPYSEDHPTGRYSAFDWAMRDALAYRLTDPTIRVMVRGPETDTFHDPTYNLGA